MIINLRHQTNKELHLTIGGKLKAFKTTSFGDGDTTNVMVVLEGVEETFSFKRGSKELDLFLDYLRDTVKEGELKAYELNLTYTRAFGSSSLMVNSVDKDSL